MTRRFSLRHVTSPDTTGDLVDGLLATFTPGPTDADLGAERSLEILVKNAGPTDVLDDSHAHRIWRDLRKRMIGPFGRLAVEGPVRSPFEPDAPKDANAPFALADQLQRITQHDTSESHEPVREMRDLFILKFAEGPRILR